MDTEWAALIAAAEKAWPEEHGWPGLRHNGTHWHAVIMSPAGEVDATALTPEAALADLTARISGTDPYQLKVATRLAEAERRLAELDAERERAADDLAGWQQRAVKSEQGM